jgi:hypothetical protein
MKTELNKNWMTQLFNLSLEDLIKNKRHVMKSTGLSPEALNEMPYYEFENLTRVITEKYTEILDDIKINNKENAK